MNSSAINCRMVNKKYIVDLYKYAVSMKWPVEERWWSRRVELTPGFFLDVGLLSDQGGCKEYEV